MEIQRDNIIDQFFEAAEFKVMGATLHALALKQPVPSLATLANVNTFEANINLLLQKVEK